MTKIRHVISIYVFSLLSIKVVLLIIENNIENVLNGDHARRGKVFSFSAFSVEFRLHTALKEIESAIGCESDGSSRHKTFRRNFFEVQKITWACMWFKREESSVIASLL